MHASNVGLYLLLPLLLVGAMVALGALNVFAGDAASWLIAAAFLIFLVRLPWTNARRVREGRFVRVDSGGSPPLSGMAAVRAEWRDPATRRGVLRWTLFLLEVLILTVLLNRVAPHVRELVHELNGHRVPLECSRCDGDRDDSGE